MKVFKAEVRSEFAEWSRYNVFLTAVCFADGAEGGYVNATGDAPLVTPPCERADLYIYVVAREFPSSTAIVASPPFDIEVVVSTDDSESVTSLKVNQFGGLSTKLAL